MNKYVVAAVAALLALATGLWVKYAVIDPVRQPLKQIEKVVPKAVKKAVKKAASVTKKAPAKQAEAPIYEKRCIFFHCVVVDKRTGQIVAETPYLPDREG